MRQSDKIKDMLINGKGTAEIVSTLGCTRQAVESARRTLAAGNNPVGKPRKRPACQRCNGTGNEPV